MNVLKLQKCFIWLLIFNNLRKRTIHNFFENFGMKTEAHLISSQSPASVYLFHELGYEVSLVGVAAILPHLPFLIQQYFEIADYVGSPSIIQVP